MIVPRVFKSRQRKRKNISIVLSSQKKHKDFSFVLFLFVYMNLYGETRTLRPSFCAAKRDIQWDRSRSEQTGQRPVESLLLRQKVSRIFLGTFSFGLQLLTRERRELYRPSFCAALPHFPNKSRKSRHRCAGKAKISR